VNELDVRMEGEKLMTRIKKKKGIFLQISKRVARRCKGIFQPERKKAHSAPNRERRRGNNVMVS